MICKLCLKDSSYHYHNASDGAGETHKIFRCSNCSHMFQLSCGAKVVTPTGAMDSLDDANLFNNSFLQKILEFSINKEAALLKKLIARTSKSKLLDIGCGTGYIAHNYSQCGFDAEGLELSRVRSQYARDHYGLKVWNVSIQEFNPETPYQVIVLRHVLEHFCDPLEILSKIHKLLDDDGIFVCVVPNLDGVGCRTFGKYWDWILPLHWQFFTPKSLQMAMIKENFEIIRCHTTPGPIGYFYAFQRLFPFLKSQLWICMLFSLPFLLIGQLFGMNDNITCICRKR